MGKKLAKQKPKQKKLVGKVGQLPQNWKPGQSGNPNGRPRREECITDLLRAEAYEKLKFEGTLMEKRQALARMVWKLALDPDNVYNCMRVYLIDRVDGKPIQRITGEGEDGSIPLEVTYKVIPRVVLNDD